MSGHSLSLANSIYFPLTMYGKVVWSNLTWPDICFIWLENTWGLAIIIGPVYMHVHNHLGGSLGVTEASDNV